MRFAHTLLALVPQRQLRTRDCSCLQYISLRSDCFVWCVTVLPYSRTLVFVMAAWLSLCASLLAGIVTVFLYVLVFECWSIDNKPQPNSKTSGSLVILLQYSSHYLFLLLSPSSFSKQLKHFFSSPESTIVNKFLNNFVSGIILSSPFIQNTIHANSLFFFFFSIFPSILYLSSSCVWLQFWLFCYFLIASHFTPIFLRRSVFVFKQVCFCFSFQILFFWLLRLSRLFHIISRLIW